MPATQNTKDTNETKMTVSSVRPLQTFLPVLCSTAMLGRKNLFLEYLDLVLLRLIKLAFHARESFGTRLSQELSDPRILRSDPSYDTAKHDRGNGMTVAWH
jgi:hypothetical protein